MNREDTADWHSARFTGLEAGGPAGPPARRLGFFPGRIRIGTTGRGGRCCRHLIPSGSPPAAAAIPRPGPRT